MPRAERARGIRQFLLLGSGGLAEFDQRADQALYRARHADKNHVEIETGGGSGQP